MTEMRNSPYKSNTETVNSIIDFEVDFDRPFIWKLNAPDCPVMVAMNAGKNDITNLYVVEDYEGPGSVTQSGII